MIAPSASTPVKKRLLSASGPVSPTSPKIGATRLPTPGMNKNPVSAAATASAMTIPMRAGHTVGLRLGLGDAVAMIFLFLGFDDECRQMQVVYEIGQQRHNGGQHEIADEKEMNQLLFEA